jgi:hypothetical protein
MEIFHPLSFLHAKQSICNPISRTYLSCIIEWKQKNHEDTRAFHVYCHVSSTDGKKNLKPLDQMAFLKKRGVVCINTRAGWSGKENEEKEQTRISLFTLLNYESINGSFIDH